MTHENTILIWGAGAIGGRLGAYWARAGEDVLLVDIVQEHVDAVTGDNDAMPLIIDRDALVAIVAA